MTISNNYPTVAPSLNLDFANSQQLDPRITFSRPTTAAYYDANTTALAEQNLFTYSQDFTNAAWTKNNVTVSGTFLAPDGTSTSQTLVENTSNTTHNIYRTDATCVGLVSISCYVKSFSGSRYVQIQALQNGGGNTAGIIVDTSGNYYSSGTSGSNITISSYNIVAVSNGFYRITLVVNVTSSASVGMVIGLSNVSTYATNPIYTGDGTSGIYIWGAQLEQRSSVTAYNATTTTAITNYIPVLLTAPTNQARFDHDPVARTSLGLLIEQQSTNLLTYSSDYTQSAWTKTQSSLTSSSNVAPDGTQTAQMLVDNSTNANHNIYYTSTLTAIPYTFSSYIKAAGANYAQITLGTASLAFGVGVFVNLSAGTLGTVTAAGGATGTSATITSVGNSWYRVSVTVTGTAATYYPAINISLNGTTNTYVGNGYEGIYIWGAQLEALAFPTSYIPTQASQVTRSADNASMTGTNFSSWYNNSQGTVYTELRAFITSAFPGIYSLDDGTTNNVILAYYSSNLLANARINASNVFTSTSSALTSTPTNYKFGMSYVTASYASVFSGGTPVTQASGAVPPSLNRLQIGLYNNYYLNSTIKKIAYYPVAVTSTQLQSLTGS